jgi:hypothetical protein
MGFCQEITKIWRKSRDFWFADFFLELFKIHSLVWILLAWIFGCFKFVSSMFCFKVNTNFLNFTNTVLLSKKTCRKHICIIRWCLVFAKKSIGYRPSGFKNLYPIAKNPRLLTKYLDFPPRLSLWLLSQGSPPGQPLPPTAPEIAESSIRLVWAKRPCDEEFR